MLVPYLKLPLCGIIYYILKKVYNFMKGINYVDNTSSY
jgi:hypothetical protein